MWLSKGRNTAMGTSSEKVGRRKGGEADIGKRRYVAARWKVLGGN